MKKIIMILMLITTLIGNSQNKLPTKNAVWKYTTFNCQNGKLDISVYSVTGIDLSKDTLNYTISGLYQLMSVQNKWILRTDTGSYTLYNYSANINDTLTLYRSDGNNLYGLLYKVKSIDSVVVSNTKIAKVLMIVINTVSGYGKPFDNLSLNSIVGNEETYLSKIGSFGSFIPLLPFVQTTCALPSLCEYQDEDIKYELSKCETVTEINPPNQKTSKESVGTEEYSIHNILGVQICSGKGYEKYLSDVEYLWPGVYVVLLMNKNKHLKTFRIAK